MKKQPSNLPTGCAAKLWLALGIWIIFTIAWFIYFDRHNQEDIFTISILCGLLSLVTAWAVRALFYRDNEKALERALQGLPLRDGQWSAAIGEIHPTTKKLLKAPFSGQDAIAYKYWVTRFAHMVPGPNPRYSKNRHLITAYAGFAMAPCEIRTNRGPVRILEMPTLNGNINKLSGEEAYQRAREYVAQTVFEDGFQEQLPPLQAAPDTGVASAASALILRKNLKENPDPDLADWMLDEVTVKPGEQVCVYGLYSSDQNALYAPPEGTSGQLFTLVMGDAQKTKASSRAQRHFLYISGFILLVIQMFIVWRTWN